MEQGSSGGVDNVGWRWEGKQCVCGSEDECELGLNSELARKNR